MPRLTVYCSFVSNGQIWELWVCFLKWLTIPIRYDFKMVLQFTINNNPVCQDKIVPNLCQLTWVRCMLHGQFMYFWLIWKAKIKMHVENYSYHCRLSIKKNYYTTQILFWNKLLHSCKMLRLLSYLPVTLISVKQHYPCMTGHQAVSNNPCRQLSTHLWHIKFLLQPLPQQSSCIRPQKTQGHQ